MASNPLKAQIIVLGDKHARWLVYAANELGVKEIKGPGYNPRIKAYHATSVASHFQNDDDPGLESAWCACFVTWCLRQAGVKSLNSYFAMRAAAYKTYGSPLSVPAFGAIAVKGRGHVGFVVASSKGGDVAILGGNQSNEVNIRRYTAAQAKDLTYRFPSGFTPLGPNIQAIGTIPLMTSTS